MTDIFNARTWGAKGDGITDDFSAIQAAISAPEWEKGTDPLTDLSLLPSPAPDSPLEALGWLGSTADEVAEGLRARGIKGRLCQADDCPLARYLRTWWGYASVWEGVSAWDTDLNSVSFYSLDTPPACFEFAKKFDAREYPDLLA